jgi:hypothetical protein
LSKRAFKCCLFSSSGFSKIASVSSSVNWANPYSSLDSQNRLDPWTPSAVGIPWLCWTLARRLSHHRPLIWDAILETELSFCPACASLLLVVVLIGANVGPSFLWLGFSSSSYGVC